MAQIRRAHSGKYAQLDREAAEFRQLPWHSLGLEINAGLAYQLSGEGKTLSRTQRVQRGRNRCCGYRLIRRGRGVPIGRDGDGERTGFSDFSVRATKCQASTLPVRRDLIPDNSICEDRTVNQGHTSITVF
ncbi:hypothetical protein [Rhizobium laguerreae]|uniref:hypothetical protein n=1 Tax=Rhizobium laguerreae TaxID=1076926 RepID=UPI001C91D054|nr:hypothetical protein [Rhizobium laguerreae]MBY3120924.1 hypothetical protein [Rhizobium laguerreae]MBY3191940.1 hypothetical protein [Rhizobium laguerreae]